MTPGQTPRSMRLLTGRLLTYRAALSAVHNIPTAQMLLRYMSRIEEAEEWLSP